MTFLPLAAGARAARRLLLSGALLATLPTLAFAQSSRPGIGATVYEGGVTFRVWAPFATSVSVAGEFNSWSTTASPMARDVLDSNYWSVDVPGAAHGDEYKFVLNGSNWKKDPRGRQVTFSGGFGSNSIVIDPAAFDWGTSPENITPFLNELVTYEMHVGTFNDPNGAPGPPGNFLDAVDRLDHLVDLGVNAIKLMPIAEFPGDLSWGYNLSDPYSVENTGYGGAQGLKTFVKEAHERGIAVILDVVHNHYGPSDLDLWQFDGWSENGGGGIYFYQTPPLSETPWGDTRPDFGRPEVRSYISDSIRMWLDEYRIDGMRWDATRFIRTVSFSDGAEIPEGRSLLQEINGWMNSQYPGHVRIAEDNANDPFVTGALGFDSDWSPDFYRTIRGAVEAASDADRDMFAVANAIIGNGRHTRRVIYSESHDETGNLNGRRRLPNDIDDANPTGYFARKRSMMANAMTMTAPGLPMLFMGQEFLTTGVWSDTNPLNWANATTQAGVLAHYRDLIHLRRNTTGISAGLKGPNVNVYHVNNQPTSKVIAFHRWDEGGVGDDVVVVANFTNQTFTNYNLGFPQGGTWNTIFNSDATYYGADFGDAGSLFVDANGGPLHGLNHSGTLEIGPYSVLLLSQATPPASVGDWTNYEF